MKSSNIRVFSEIKGYSQEYVSGRLGKSQAAFSRIENGHTHLSDDIIEQISKVLEIPKEELFEDENDLLQPLKEMASGLLKELSENKKLLHEVELNQSKLLRQLTLLLEKLVEKEK